MRKGLKLQGLTILWALPDYQTAEWARDLHCSAEGSLSSSTPFGSKQLYSNFLLSLMARNLIE